MRLLLAIIGLIGVLAGVALGLYVGVWVMFVGGIMGLVSIVTTLVAGGGVVASLLAWSIVKIMFAGVVGWICAFIIITPSFGLMGLAVE